MIKKSVIWIFVLSLLASSIYAQNEVCCLLPIAGECVYGESSHTDLIVITKEFCESDYMDGTVIEGVTSAEQCASHTTCLKGCCCEIEAGSKVGKEIPEGLCKPTDWRGQQDNCLTTYCDDKNICGDGDCIDPENAQNCPQDCEEIITPPGEEEEEVPECTDDSDCKNKCVGNTKKYNGWCDEGICQYSSEEECGEKICIVDKCVEKVNCEECNSPLGLYGMITACDQGDFNWWCYLDYTNTIVDAYQECENVNICYDYKSKRACNENKCLQGICIWNNNNPYRYDELGVGVCRPENVDEQDCGKCNTLTRNSIFDKCDVIRCGLFGNYCEINNGNCVLNYNPYCGDGNININIGEECDGTNLDYKTCSDVGDYNSGELKCYPRDHEKACTFDKSGCRREVHNPPTLSNLQIKEIVDSTENDIKGLDKSGAEYGNDIKFSIDAEADEGFSIDRVDLIIYQCDESGENCVTGSSSGITGSVTAINRVTGMVVGSYEECDVLLTKPTTKCGDVCPDDVLNKADLDTLAYFIALSITDYNFEMADIDNSNDINNPDLELLITAVNNNQNLDEYCDQASFCGNDEVEEGEECDDGNTENGDGCDSNCYLEVCGNGIIQSGEQCDCGTDGVCSEEPTDDNLRGELDGKSCADIRPNQLIGLLSCYPPGSSNECQFNAEKCGEIVIPENMYEGLSPADANTCGDGIVQTESGEQCDCEEGDMWCSLEELKGESCTSLKTRYPVTYHYFYEDDRPNGIYLWCYPPDHPLRCKYNYQGCIYSKQPCFIDVNCDSKPGQKCHPTEYYCYTPVVGACTITSVGIELQDTNSDGFANPGETISITVTIDGDCSELTNIQIDASETGDENGNCVIQHSGGKMRGIDGSVTASQLTTTWTIPSIHSDCIDKTIIPYAVGLYKNSITPNNRIGGTNNVDGSFQFAPQGISPATTETFPKTYSDIPHEDNTYSITIENPEEDCKLLKGVYKAEFTAYDNTNLRNEDNGNTALFKIKIEEPLKLITGEVPTQTPTIWIWLEKQETGQCTINYAPYGYDTKQGPFNFNPSIEDGCGFRKASINIQEDWKLKEGENSVDIYCKFNDNSEKTITRTITVDKTPPELYLYLRDSQISDDHTTAYLTTGTTHLKIYSNERLSECKYIYSDTEISDIGYDNLQYSISTSSYSQSSENVFNINNLYLYEGGTESTLNLANGRHYFYAMCKDEVENPSEIKTLIANVNIAVCGNNIAEPGEECDGSVTIGCEDLEFTGGTLSCYGVGSEDECTYNTEQCTDGTGYCGDNEINPGETCDGEDWGSITECSEVNSEFTSGILDCYGTGPSECHFDTRDCIKGVIIPTLIITLLEPNAGYSTIIHYHVKISTDKEAECRYMYSTTEINYPSYNSLSNQFTTTDLIHTTPDDIDETIEFIYINCRDLETTTENKIRFKIGYDTNKPIITKLITDDPQNKIIEEIDNKLQKTVYVKTNKPTICRYDKTTNVFENMQGNFTDEGVNDYKTNQDKVIQDPDFVQEASVTFNIVCKARNGLISDPEQITINVDLNAALEITNTYPTGYVGKDETKLRVGTNKHADCRFYKEETDYGTTTNKKEKHESDLITGLEDGQHEFDVECTKGEENVNGKITFIVDTSPPDTPDVTAESYCYRKDGESCKIKASWSSEDLQSEIRGYYYYVANKTTDKVLFEDYTDEEESEELDYNDLDLENKFADGDEFEFLVSAQNNARLLSENGTDTAVVDYSIIRDDNIPPVVKAYFNDDEDLVLDCEDNVDDECAVLKYYLASDDCPTDESEYDDYSAPISITSESITRVCWIAKDSSGNVNKDSKKIKDIDDKEKDTDGDGMPDSWEEKYNCLDKNRDDALADYDEDGLINREEYYYGTDPCNVDTDGDGFTDNEEIDAKTDPLDEYDYPIKEVGDSDNDGMLDNWEDRYDCVDKNTADANEDPDSDGLTNKEEYNYGTNPCDPDSDDDGYTDGVEIEKGTDPLDSEDYPKSRWWLWTIIIILVLAVLGAASYFGYEEYKKMIREGKKPIKEIPKLIRKIPSLLEIKKGRELMKKKEKEKEERRKKLFEAFVPGRKEEKIEEIKPKKHEIDIFERLPKIIQEDIFKKLPGEEDVFKKLPKAGKEIFEKLPITKKKKIKKRKKRKKKVVKKKRKEKGGKRRKSKKAQIAGQVIIYILAVLIFGLIVTFGYREINNLIEKQKKIDLINFENNLKDTIEGISASYGDVKVYDVDNPLKVPGGYNELCFIELDKPETGHVSSSDYPLIYNSWQDNVKANVFLDDAEYSFYADNITIEGSDNSKCFTITKGKINNMRLEGIGGSAKISES